MRSWSVKSQVTSVDLHHHFHALGVGTIEDVRVQRDKGFGFVRYSTHGEAALAIQMGNTRFLFGKPIKVNGQLAGYYNLSVEYSIFSISYHDTCLSFMAFCLDAYYQKKGRIKGFISICNF